MGMTITVTVKGNDPAQIQQAIQQVVQQVTGETPNVNVSSRSGGG